jgi:pyruvate/2-oxoglutarate/acetoin dehydrogenase E1 component/TPP-dependent pyruvate/acetoin dehydrogenase alpha subunit
MRPVQLLNPAGELAHDPRLELGVTAELCVDLYRRMRMARRFDQECQHLQRQGELGLWLSCGGQEAAQVGSITAIHDDDHVFPSYREHAAALSRGIAPDQIMAQWRGCRNSGWSPQKHRFHIYTLVLAAQTLHATGYAMGLRRDGLDEMVLTYLGDGASSEGDANEAFNWAAVTHSPVLFFCQNNGWAISTPTSSQMRTPLHERAAGFGLRTMQVDGNDVLAVHAATQMLADSVRAGGGPALIEAMTYRMAGHSTADDPTRYRADEDVQRWQELDPLTRLEAFMRYRDWLTSDVVAATDELCDDLARETRQMCPTLPVPDLQQVQDSVLSTAGPLASGGGPGGPAHAPARRDAPADAGQPPLAKALNRALRDAMADDDRVVMMGQDVGPLGGVFRVTDGLQREFGAERVMDTPLAESGIVGTAIGLALRGFRPVCEIQFDGFVYPAFNQIVSQLAKMRARTLGEVVLPLVIRIPVGGGIGAVEHHSESNEAYFTHTAGLRVVYCSSGDDAYWMLRQAIESDDPVIFYEPKRRYWSRNGVRPIGREERPLGAAQVARDGTDLTVLTYGGMLDTCLRAAEIAEEDGRSLEVIDLRSLVPLDVDVVIASVKRTRRAIVAHEAPTFGGFGAEVGQLISERCYFHLEAPVRRVGGLDMPYPPAKLEHEYLPDVDRVLDVVDEVFNF